MVAKLLWRKLFSVVEMSGMFPSINPVNPAKKSKLVPAVEFVPALLRRKSLKNKLSSRRHHSEGRIGLPS